MPDAPIPPPDRLDSVAASLAARVRAIVESAEHEAAEASADLETQRRQAAAEARRYVAETRLRVDALAEERLERLRSTTERLIARAQELNEQVEDLASAVRQATRAAEREALPDDLLSGPEPEPAPAPEPPAAPAPEPRAAAPAPLPEPEPAPEPEPRGFHLSAFRRAQRRPERAAPAPQPTAGARPEPARESEPEPRPPRDWRTLGQPQPPRDAAPPAVPAPAPPAEPAARADLPAPSAARLAAIQLAVAGSTRAEVELHLLERFGPTEAQVEEILDDVFGPRTEGATRMSWGPAA